MRIHQVPANEISHLPILKIKVDNTKPLYSLFENRNGRWERISEASYTSAQMACFVFGDRLLQSPLTIQIRPIEIKPLAANIRFNR